MADDQDKASKTEQPTGKRLADAKRKGQVARSQEIGSWAMLIAAALALTFLAPWVMRNVSLIGMEFIGRAHSYPMDFGHIRLLFFRVVSDVGLVLAPLFALFTLVAFGATLAQVGWTVSMEKLQFRPNAFNPVNGLKRMFGLRALVEFAKGIVKLAVIGTIFIFVTIPLIQDVQIMPAFSVSGMLDRMHDIALILLVVTICVMTVVAVVDYLYQRYQHVENLKMTKQEVKDERKQMDGDPKIKQRIAQLRMERARQRMMAAVAKADVVITNPTHYAVALQYDMEAMAAPKLVGKGIDDVAMRIREVADENEVPIVENPPLARAIYASVELEQEIPPQYYHAVAEVISYVFRLKGRLARRPGDPLRPPEPDWSLDPENNALGGSEG